MNKIKVTNVNILLLTIALLISFFPQLASLIMEFAFKIDISELITKNETAKIIALCIDQYLFIFLPIIIFTIASKLNIKETFRLNPISLSACVLTLIMAVAAWYLSIYATLIVQQIYSVFFGQPSNMLEEIIPQNMYAGLFLIALTPAFCEEALFRGVILKAYENRGTVKAVMISAIFFATIHFSIIRFAGPLIIGILAGYLVVRSNSIIPGILTHFTFNGISIILYYFSKGIQEETSRMPNLTEYAFLTLLALFAISTIMICIWGFISLTSSEKNPEKKNFLFRLFFGRPTNQAVFNKSVSSVSKDFVSIFSNWPIIVIVLIFLIFNVLDIFISS